MRFRSPRLRSEDGFALVTVMGVLMAVSLASVAAFAATTGDLPGGTADVDRKQGSAGAEAGIQAYAYWANVDRQLPHKCDRVPPEQLKVNQRVPPDAPRRWNNVPGSSAEYAIEILPAPGYSLCTNDPASVIAGATQSFRIRSTGRTRRGGPKASLIGTFRKPSFADYLYFTDVEDSNNPLRGPADDVKGPLHTNGSLWGCGNPTIGRNPSDAVEVVSTQAGAIGLGTGSCSGAPKVNVPPSNAIGDAGTLRFPAGNLQMPQSNQQLRADTAPEYRFRGTTQITFTSNGRMRVLGYREDGRYLDNANLAMPGNGRIYVSNDSCPGGYRADDPYNPATMSVWSCGTAWVSGTYSSNVTVGAESDIVITDDLRRSGNVVAGLVANNWIRVYRPTTRAAEPYRGTCRYGNPLGTPPGLNWPSAPTGDLNIDAVILSLTRSFTVDNYACRGISQPMLSVTGAIAQRTRGPVGTSTTGYRKDYEYDNRLRYLRPPGLPEPVTAGWTLVTQQEQVPAQ